MKLPKKKIVHKPKKPDLPATQAGLNEVAVSEANTSEEEISLSVDKADSASLSHKIPPKQKKTKKQVCYIIVQ